MRSRRKVSWVASPLVLALFLIPAAPPPERQRRHHRRRQGRVGRRRRRRRADPSQHRHRSDIATTVSGPDGEYAFRNLAPAKYDGRGHEDRVPAGHASRHRRDAELACSGSTSTLPVGAQETRVEVVGGSSVLSVTGTQEHGISPETLNQLPLLMNSGPRAAAAFATLMPGVSTGGGNNAFDARINGGLQSGDEAIARRRQHAAGLHEPGRHGLDLPGLPDVAGHGERGQGADLELRARVRVVDLRADHGGHQVGRQLVPRRGLRVPPERFAESHAVGRRRQARVQAQQLRREHRRPGQAAGSLVRQRQELLLLQLRGLPADRRLEPADAVDSVDAERNGDFTRLARRQRQPDSDLRPGDPPFRRPRRLHQGSVHGLRRQHAQRDLPEPHQPADAAVAGGAADIRRAAGR